MTSVTDPIEALETRDVGLQALCGIAAYYRIIATPVHVRRELALRDQEVGPADLVRAAQLIGLRARIIFPLEKNRLAALPADDFADALRRLRGLWRALPSGEYRLVNPLTRADRALSLDNLFEQAAEAVLVSASWRGGDRSANFQPQMVPSFDLAVSAAVVACASRLVFRADFRARHAAVLSGGDRQGAQP